MELKELLELNLRTSEILGWNGAAHFEIHLDSETEGDVFYSQDINGLTMGEISTDYAQLSDLVFKLEKVWLSYAKRIEIKCLENRYAPNKWYVWIEINTEEE